MIKRIYAQMINNDGEGGSYENLWVLKIDEDTTDGEIEEFLIQNEGVHTEGYTLEPRSYDCTGRWWPHAIEICRTTFRAFIIQRWSCDI